MLRDGLSSDEAARRIQSQMSQEEKKSFADYLVDTSNGFESTRDQVSEIFLKLKVSSDS
jgi:dephospho-CoA kinase